MNNININNNENVIVTDMTNSDIYKNYVQHMIDIIGPLSISIFGMNNNKIKKILTNTFGGSSETIIRYAPLKINCFEQFLWEEKTTIAIINLTKDSIDQFIEDYVNYSCKSKYLITIIIVPVDVMNWKLKSLERECYGSKIIKETQLFRIPNIIEDNFYI